MQTGQSHTAALLRSKPLARPVLLPVRSPLGVMRRRAGQDVWQDEMWV